MCLHIKCILCCNLTCTSSNTPITCTPLYVYLIQVCTVYIAHYCHLYPTPDLTYVVTIQTSIGEASTDPITLQLEGRQFPELAVMLLNIVYNTSMDYSFYMCSRLNIVYSTSMDYSFYMCSRLNIVYSTSMDYSFYMCSRLNIVYSTSMDYSLYMCSRLNIVYSTSMDYSFYMCSRLNIVYSTSMDYSFYMCSRLNIVYSLASTCVEHMICFNHHFFSHFHKILQRSAPVPQNPQSTPPVPQQMKAQISTSRQPSS